MLINGFQIEIPPEAHSSSLCRVTILHIQCAILHHFLRCLFIDVQVNP